MRFLSAVLCLSMLSVHAGERIISFDADILVNKNATLTVREEITVKALGQQIQRGIVREFPTQYLDDYGHKVVVDFYLRDVLVNGAPIEHTVEKKHNGVYVYVGDPKQYLAPGIYTFTLVYEVNRILGFFDKHDELYWNVTGNGWRLPIDRATAHVRLPEGVDTAHIQVAGYTGSYGQEGKDVQADVLRSGAVRFKTTRSFEPYEGLTIVVGWPKGHVTPPDFKQKLLWFLRDNTIYGCMLLALFSLFLLFMRIHRANNKRKGAWPVIPLFYPPKDMTPGMLNYHVKQTYTETALAAEIVQMAVKGWLTIESVKDFPWGTTYILHKKNAPDGKTDPLYEKLWRIFFQSHENFTIDLTRSDDLMRARAVVQAAYATNDTFETHATEKFFVFFLSALCIPIFIVLKWPLGLWVLFLLFFALVATVGFNLLNSYTEQGYDLLREIDGFKLFLSVTEKDRMEMVGTPPTESPQLYETYLPYAIALGVERQWTDRFNAVFERLKKSGNAYTPIWFVSPRGQAFVPGAFSSGFTRTVTSSISSAVSAPGKTSGLSGRSGGGGGFSGGGGGGGGGGGW